MSGWTAEPYGTAAARRGHRETADGGLRDRVASALAWLQARRERRRLYNQTVRELSQLSDRDLDDIGVSRWDIRDIAARHTRERLGR